MILTRLKKLFSRKKKEELQISTTSTVQTTTSNTILNFEVSGTNSNVNYFPNPTALGNFGKKEMCNNCNIPMIKKTEGIKQSRPNKKNKRYFVCMQCGFERKLK